MRNPLIEDQPWALRAYQLTIEILKYLHFFEIREYSQTYQKFTQNFQFFEEDYFFQDDIKTLQAQIGKFDKAIQTIAELAKKKQIPNKAGALEPQIPSNSNPNKLKPMSEIKKKPSEPKEPNQQNLPKEQNPPPVELLSEKVLSGFLTKKNKFLRSLFRENEDPTHIKANFFDYQRENKNVIKNTDPIFAQIVPDHMSSANDAAVSQIFIEIDFFQKVGRDFEQLGSDISNQDKLSELRQRMKRAINEVFPGFDWDKMGREELAKRGESARDVFELSESQMEDGNYVAEIERLKKEREENERELANEEKQKSGNIPENEVKSEMVESVENEGKGEIPSEKELKPKSEEKFEPKISDLKSNFKR